MSEGRAQELRIGIARARAELCAIENGTWAILAQVGRDGITPEGFAAAARLSRPAANNRLFSLFKVGLANREYESVEGGGRSYRYSLLSPTTEEER